jgi:hypothetical protein
MSRALIVTKEAEADILDGYRSYEERLKRPGFRELNMGKDAIAILRGELRISSNSQVQ